MKALIRFCVTSLLIVPCLPRQVVADWPCRSDISVPIVTSSGNQYNVRIASDGKNGAIMVWQDRRNGSFDKLYVQRMNAYGNPVWADGGILLSSTSGFQYYPQILEDGQGGAFIVWEDNRSGLDYDIFAQRVASNGVILWNPGGIAVCNAIGHQYNPHIAPDGLGGILIAWQDGRNDQGQFDIFAQRLNGGGHAMWTQNGVAACLATGDQTEPRLVQDGSGGAIVTWSDYRSGTSDIYAQRILSNGQVAWTTDGVVVCNAANVQQNVQLVSDGAGGSILSWQDRRTGTFDNIYAQRIDANGQRKWNVDGVQVAPSPGPQYYPQMVSDGSDGAVITWQDNRTGTDYDIYAQRLNISGQTLWAANGLAVCTAAGHQYNPQLVRDESSVLITWQDKRKVTDFDIYAQRLDLSGIAEWQTNGNAVCISPYDQYAPQLTVDSLQGAIITWADYRGASGFTDIYSQRVGSNGKLAGGCFQTFTQDSLGLKATKWTRRGGLPMPNAGNVRDAIFTHGLFPDGIVIGIPRLDSIRRYGWEYYSRSYFVRRTFPQNGAPRPFAYFYDRYFTGFLRNPLPRLYNNSLAAELLTMKLNIGASDAGITEPQFGDLVYHDTTGFYNPLNKKSLREISTTVDSMLTYWRKYTGVDYFKLYSTLHTINMSFDGPIDTISTSPLKIKPVKGLFSTSSLVPNTVPPAVLPAFQPQPADEEIPAEFTVSQNYPNPFNPYTIINFDVPEPANVTLRVFNVLGQEIAVLINHETIDDGPQMVGFDGTNLSSGVYFYQVVVEPLNHVHKLLSSVKKMVLLK